MAATAACAGSGRWARTSKLLFLPTGGLGRSLQRIARSFARVCGRNFRGVSGSVSKWGQQNERTQKESGTKGGRKHHPLQQTTHTYTETRIPSSLHRTAGAMAQRRWQ